MTKKKIVSNSSPIILSSKIDFFPILKKMYRGIIIPEGVYNEITSKKDVHIEQMIQEEFFQVQIPQNTEKNRKLIQIFRKRGDRMYCPFERDQS